MPSPSALQRLFAELKRRHVFKVATVYGATGFAVLQVASLLAGGMGLPPVVLRVTTYLVIVGFPIAVVLAWALEITPEGVKRTDPVTAAELDAIVARPARHRWPSGLLALVGVAALVLGAWWVGRRLSAEEPSAPEGAAPGAPRVAMAGVGGAGAAVLKRAYADLSRDSRPSVAVLPFADLSPKHDQGYFADGMTEELMNALTRIRQLRVAGRTSSFAFKGKDENMRQIGKELGVRYLVAGSVRKQGNHLRITAQLVDDSSDFQLWSNAYDRTLDDVFRIQTDIAEAVAGQLKVSLGLAADSSLVKPTTDQKAYDLYLTGRERMRARGTGVRAAVSLFRQATERDPEWAPAWAGLAQAYSLVPYYAKPDWEDVDSATWAAALDSAGVAARRALSLDPQNAAAEVALGNAFRDRWQWREAESHYLKALAIDPDDVEAHQQYAEMLAGEGRVPEAVRSARRAVALDPSSLIRLNALGFILDLDGKVSESIEVLSRAVEARPGFPSAYTNLARAYLHQGDLAGAVSALRAMPAAFGVPVSIDSLERGWKANDGPMLLACCHGIVLPSTLQSLGDTASALAAVGRLARFLADAPPYSPNGLDGIWLLPPSLVHDPRIAPLLERAGLKASGGPRE